MSKEGGVLYISGVDRRTELLGRAFQAKNDITLAKMAKYSAGLWANYPLGQLFTGKVADYNPLFDAFDRVVRDFMEKNTPEDYRRIPLWQRLFGRVYKPLTRADIQKVDDILKAEETDVEEPVKEAPPVDASETE